MDPHPHGSRPAHPFPYYLGQGKRAPGAEDDVPQTLDLPPPSTTRLTRPQLYQADEGLQAAVNVALLLGQPLLLTGEPGTGKTELASSLAWELGLAAPLKFATKSTSVSTDLFYTYNALARFHDAQLGLGERSAGPIEPEAIARRSALYLRFNPLGQAILRANPPDGPRAWLAGVGESGATPGRPQRSVVLVDEIDKASRDFPNDLLVEIERLAFRIPELNGEEFTLDAGPRPIVVITSNSEKNLPDAFLRRCVYYHIPFPTEVRLRAIVEDHLQAAFETEAGDDLGAGFLDQALKIFQTLREPSSRLRKPPGPAELLNWVLAVRRYYPRDPDALKQGRPALGQTLGALVKTKDDLDAARQALKPWFPTAGAPS